MTEVTNAHYDNCVRAGFCDPTYGDGECYIMDERDRPGRAVVLAEFKAPNRPVVCVRHEDAANYCKWVGKRLPTEAEWEKAAGGNSRSEYPWGNDPASCVLAVMSQGGYGCGTGHTADVCSEGRPRSVYGACDMAGNVWEWVSDWYAGAYPADPFSRRNPQGPKSGSYRVLRGGAFNTGAHSLRTSKRYSQDPQLRFNNHGFRCVVGKPMGARNNQ